MRTKIKSMLAIQWDGTNLEEIRHIWPSAKLRDRKLRVLEIDRQFPNKGKHLLIPSSYMLILPDGTWKAATAQEVQATTG